MRGLVGSITLMLLLLNTSTSAQEWSLGIGRRYTYSPQWDKVIQTYNTSRPFLKEKQPLLTNGTLAEFSYHFKSTKKLGSGIKLGHSYVGSRAVNEGYRTKLSLHLFDLGYVLRFKPKQRPNALEYELDIAVITHILSSKVDREILTIDEEAYRSYGIGGKLQATILYRLHLADAWTILPFIGLGYAPYLHSPQTEVLINQTHGLVETQKVTLITWQIGMRFNFTAVRSETIEGPGN